MASKAKSTCSFQSCTPAGNSLFKYSFRFVTHTDNGGTIFQYNL